MPACLDVTGSSAPSTNNTLVAFTPWYTLPVGAVSVLWRLTVTSYIINASWDASLWARRADASTYQVAASATLTHSGASYYEATTAIPLDAVELQIMGQDSGPGGHTDDRFGRLQVSCDGSYTVAGQLEDCCDELNAKLDQVLAAVSRTFSSF